jgi:hypothetical protein
LDAEKIIKMAVSYWSDDDQCFVCDCAIFSQAVGNGDTPQEAREAFESALAQSDLAQFPPTATVTPEGLRGATLGTLQDLKDSFGCSADEAIDYLAHFFMRASLNDKMVDEYDPNDPDLVLLARGELELIPPSDD